jgi:UDPglucose 6-dehydrogenase
MKPDRVVIGASSPRAVEFMRELYEPFVRTGNPILIMDNASAEMTKYAANALLATRISFMNEIANLCERVGADVDHVRRGIGYDRRIGHHFLFPGVGYGGSCFPKDVKAVIHTAHEHGMKFPLLNAVEDVNEAQKRLLVEKVTGHFGDALAGHRFAVWGLAFKPRTDDMREAPSITIVEGLLARGAELAVHDPEALGEARRLFGERVTYHRVNYEALRDADALLIVTEWNEFRRPDFVRMKRTLRRPIIFDGRNLYDPDVMREHGFTYVPIGRAAVRPAD